MNLQVDFPFKAIAAMSLNRVIGSGNKLPWHLPEDFKWFKEKTMGQVVVMGRKTYESIGKPLPGRLTYVLSRHDISLPGVRVFSSLEAIPIEGETREIFICGGAEIYRQALPRCSDLFLTLVNQEMEGDAYFPPFEETFGTPTVVRETLGFKILHFRNRHLTC